MPAIVLIILMLIRDQCLQYRVFLKKNYGPVATCISEHCSNRSMFQQ